MSEKMFNQHTDGRPDAVKRIEAVDEGIVLKHVEGFETYGVRDVYAWEHEGTFYMHYDAADSELGWLCSLATSKDLVHWEKHGPVLELGEDGEDDSKAATYGVTYYDEGVWHMYYLGTPNTSKAPERVPDFPYLTMKAKSKSPMGPWEKQKDIIPFRPIPNTYTSATASPGQIIKYKGEYLQFFSASVDNKFEGVKRTISIARTKNLLGEWRLDETPILPLEEQIENSALYYQEKDETWFLFTNHIGYYEGVGEYTDAIWVYWSKDLNHWNKHNKAVVLDNKNCRWSKYIIGLPSVIKTGNRLAILYDGLSTDDISHCHRDIGLAWLELPIKI